MDKIRATIAHFSNNSLGISRRDMPQIESKDVPDFLRWLQKEYGVNYRKTTLPAKSIQHVQGELNVGKIGKFLDGSAGSKQNLNKPVIVSDDLYLLDGHHRHAAQYAISPNYPTPVYKLIGMGIEDLLEVVKMYHGHFTKELHESALSKTFSEWLEDIRIEEAKAAKKAGCSCGCGNCGG